MTPNPSDQLIPFAYSPENAAKATGGALSRTRIFALIKDGEIDARKVGRRTVILSASLKAYLERQPKAAA
jgi:excisionase family DNA binding protein